MGLGGDLGDFQEAAFLLGGLLAEQALDHFRERQVVAGTGDLGGLAGHLGVQVEIRGALDSFAPVPGKLGFRFVHETVMRRDMRTSKEKSFTCAWSCA